MNDNNMADGTDEVSSPFLRLVGERLRSIRLQKNMSLGDVETRSNNEFKASVLGAYERGERAISVPRLERLARFYDVGVDQLLPRDPLRVEPGSSSAGQVAHRRGQVGPDAGPTVFDAREVATHDSGAAARLQWQGHHGASPRHSRDCSHARCEC